MTGDTLTVDVSFLNSSHFPSAFRHKGSSVQEPRVSVVRLTCV